MRPEPKEVVYFLCCILLLAFLLRIYPLEEYHGWDEATYLQHAEHLFSGKSNYDEFAFRPPLLPIMIAGGFFIWHSPWIAVIICALLSTSIVLAVFLITNKLHSATAGLFAATIVALHPLFVTYGHFVLTDALVASLAAFALYFALDDDPWSAFSAGALAALASLMKFTALAIAGILFLFLAWNMRRQFRITPLLTYLAGFLLFFAPYLAWAKYRYGDMFIVFEKAQSIVNNVHGGTLFYLDLNIFIIPLIIGIALFFYYWKTYHNLHGFALMALAWTASLLAYLMTFPNRELRYALVALVPIFALSGIGYARMLKTVKKYRSPAVIGILLVILIFSLNSFSRLSEPGINHWKSPSVETALHIASFNTTNPIYATSFYPVYGYYTSNPVIIVDGPRFLDAYPRIMPRDGYLVIYKDSTRAPTVTWADREEHLMRIHENEAIVLYAYKK
jgi:4-amino-4-deoxy-L-arabinose transferase-like glycosyltransferase